jgi:hypothetical protein
MIPIMPQEKPLSLRPLKFKEAVSDLLKVKPPAKNISTHEEHEAQKKNAKKMRDTAGEMRKRAKEMRQDRQ